MARIRSIRPEFWTDIDLSRIPRDARLLYIALWNFADDDGRGIYIPRQIYAFAFPFDDDIDINALLKFLSDGEFIRVYEVNRQRFFDIPTFKKHQKTEKPLPSKHPPYSELVGEESGRSRGDIGEESLQKTRVDIGGCNLGVVNHNNPHPPRGSAPRKSDQQSEDEQCFESEVWPNRPRREPHPDPKGEAKRSFLKCCMDAKREGLDRSALVLAHARYRKVMEDTGKIGSETIQQVATFFGVKKATWRQYLEEQPLPTHPNGNGQKEPTFAELQIAQAKQAAAQQEAIRRMREAQNA